MAESKFKVGDRVKVFVTLQSVPYETPGTVTAIMSPRLIKVNLDRVETTAGKIIGAHPKQCRRLIKKPRRRVWVHGNPKIKLGDAIETAGDLLFYISTEPSPTYKGAYIEFVEVKKK